MKYDIFSTKKFKPLFSVFTKIRHSKVKKVYTYMILWLHVLPIKSE